MRGRKNHPHLVDTAGVRTPPPPPELSAEAAAEWRLMAKKLFHAGIATELDRGILIAYCQAFGRWAQAERTLAAMAARDPLTGALMIKTTNGNAIQNPLVSVANKALSDMARYAAELGMTPSARARVSVFESLGKKEQKAETAERLSGDGHFAVPPGPRLAVNNG